jgi:signal transduction histidine kinase
MNLILSLLVHKRDFLNGRSSQTGKFAATTRHTIYPGHVCQNIFDKKIKKQVDNTSEKIINMRRSDRACHCKHSEAIYLTPSPTSPHPSPIGEGEREGWVVVQITDSGCGIPEEIKHQIFEPFFTTKPAGEGSGLGLNIVKKIIEKHQGKINVKSCPGRTTFSILLPILQQEI